VLLRSASIRFYQLNLAVEALPWTTLFVEVLGTCHDSIEARRYLTIAQNLKYISLVLKDNSDDREIDVSLPVDCANALFGAARLCPGESVPHSITPSDVIQPMSQYISPSPDV